MAALVVVDVSRATLEGASEARLEIFPGSAIPTMFRAGEPFWVGYAFAPDGKTSAAAGLLDMGTRFELDVDGRSVTMTSQVEREGADPVRKTDFAPFPNGLPAGWHDLTGRWYDRGKLILSSRASVQFVER
jgi:hypothetical protein